MKRLGEEQVTTLDFLRHGHCEGGEIYRGSTDVALSEQGKAQMLASIERASQNGGRPWHKIITSPLQRCRLLATELANEWKMPLEIEEDFREMSFGHWEGRPVVEVHELHKDEVISFYSNPLENTPKDGESVQEVQNRVGKALDGLIKVHANQHLLLVQHGVSIRIALMTLLSIPLNQLSTFEIPYAGMARVKIYTGKNTRRVVLSNLNQF